MSSSSGRGGKRGGGGGGGGGGGTGGPGRGRGGGSQQPSQPSPRGEQTGSAGRGRGRGSQQPSQPPSTGDQTRAPAPQPSRPAWSSASSAQSSLVEEFPSLQISTPPRAPAWGPRPTQQPQPQQPQQQQQQQQPKQQPQIQPTLIQEVPEPKKPEPVVEPKKSEFISSSEEPSSFQPIERQISTTSDFPLKPKERGSLGRPIKLRTNHYQIAILKPFTVYQYDVEFTRKSFKEKKGGEQQEKEIKNKDITKLMFLKLTSLLPADYNNKLVYNFSKNLYSLKKLPFEESITYEIEIERAHFILKLKIINQVLVDPARYDDPVSIQILDLIFTHNFNYSCVNLNRSFFKGDSDFHQLGFGLELWKGAYSSVRPSEVGLTWNIDSANAAFLTSLNLLEVASYHYNCDYNQLKGAIENDRDGNITGKSFLDNYQGRDIKTRTGGFRKKIKAFGPNALYKFNWTKPNNQTVNITISDYLKEHYGITLKYPNLPCVDLGKNSFLPMELCSTEQKSKKKLDEKETQEMIKIAAVRAPERMNYIQNWAERSEIQKDPILREYNIKLNLRLLEVDGRVLEPPDIQYLNNKTQSRQIGEKGSWDHRNFKFNSAIRVERWIVINFAFRVREDAANNFISTIIRVGKIHGIEMKNPLDYISETRRGIRDEEVRRIFENVANKYKPLNLIVVFFGGTMNAYKVMKTCGDLTYGIPTQGVEDRNVNRINDQTISNILLKINTKLGGTNFILSKENRLFAQHIQTLFNGPLMVFGADVTHPGPGDNQLSESIAAVVGSLDKECCYYAARLYAQKAPRGKAYEMIHDLDKMFISLINQHFELNKVYPKKIVFYRDGVSEGQFSLVLRHEMNKIRSACIHINPSYKPSITFVVVQKRHHTRLFPVNQQDQNGKAANVPPGTVVDKTIVTPNMFDFFLCSHAGIQGTSRPCRYFVLHDDNGFSMNQMQILSHYFCHIYSRCPRSVSYPAPAYYSHLVAFRGRDYIRRQPPPGSPNTVQSYEIELHPNLRNKMFYT